MSVKQTILKDSEALRAFLENLIPCQPKGRAEYTTLPRSNFSDTEYQRLLILLEELKKGSSIGYREWDRSVSIVIHKRQEA